MTNIVMVKQSGKKYLFSVPMGTTLKKYDKVVCDTARGEQEGICFTDSFIVEADALKQIALFTGATLPLKSVIGKSEMVRFKDKPQKNKFKVGEKYKVNIAFPIEGGDIIEITKIDDVLCHYKTIVNTNPLSNSVTRVFGDISSFAKCLTPYTETETAKEPEKHTYKNGDYVKIISNKNCDFEVGHIVKLNYKANNGWWNCTWNGFEDEHKEKIVIYDGNGNIVKTLILFRNL